MSFKTASLSVIAVLCVAFVFITIISDDRRVEGKRETRNSASTTEKLSEEKKRKREAHYIIDDWDDDNEVIVGRKKFKMFEKKKLNHKKAQAVCKKKDGHLAFVTNLEEMTRLQTLLMRAKTVGDDIWVGADKKEWKKHSLKVDKRRPNFGPDTTMFGGGPTEMCPALSVSTRSLNPVMCMKELAFVCEFELQKPTTTMKPTTITTTRKGKLKTKKESGNAKPKTNKVKGRNKNKIEMKRRKREVIPIPTTTGINIMNKTNDRDQVGKKEEQEEDDKDDSDSEEEDGTGLENYVTENPMEAAAEHNIGFSPHVEHLLLQIEKKESIQPSSLPESTSSELETNGSESPTLVDENSIQSVESLSFALPIQVKISTKITVVDPHPTYTSHSQKPITTTMDPDQQLIDLIDEQTMNLTAIEMESANLSHTNLSTNSPTQNSTDNENFKGQVEKKISEFLDENDLAVTSDISHAHLENDENDNDDDEKTRKKKENEIESSTDEFGDNSTILSFDYYRDDLNGSSSSSSSINSYISNKSESEAFTTDIYNLTDSIDNTNSSSNVTSGYLSVNDDNSNNNLTDDANLTTTEEKVVENNNNKRLIRNVSHTIQMPHDNNNIEDEIEENTPSPITLKDKIQHIDDVPGLNETSTNSSSPFNSSFTQINETIIMEETSEIGENSTSNMIHTNNTNTLEMNSTSTSPQSFQLPIIEKSQHSITQKPLLLSTNEMTNSTTILDSLNMMSSSSNPSINTTNAFTNTFSTTDDGNEINSSAMSTSIDIENSTISSTNI